MGVAPLKTICLGWTLAALVGVGSSPARGGAPAPSDVVAGLLDPRAEVRAATATRLGAADIVAAAPAIPALVEALDDEVPDVANAAQDAIVALANRAVSVVFEDLDAAVGHESVSGVFVALGEAAGVTADFAAGLLEANETERRVLWVAMAILPGNYGAGPEVLRSRLRMAAIESARTRGADRRSASAAVALIGYRLAREHARRLPGATPSLSAPSLLPRLARVVAETTDERRSSFAWAFVAATGLGDGGVVAALVAAARTTAPFAGDVRRPCDRALARLSASDATARGVLERLSPRALVGHAEAIASTGGERVVAERARLVSGDDALGLARLAAEAGDRSPSLIPILARGLDAAAADARIEDAGFGIAAMGESAVSTRPALEALLPKLADRRGPRIAVGSALLAVAPGHESATAALLEEAAKPWGAATDSLWKRDRRAGELASATRALAQGGTGGVVLHALERLLEPMTDPKTPRWHELVRLRAAAAGIVRLAGDEASGAAIDLADLLVRNEGVEADDESAEAYRRLGIAAPLPYEIRSIGLRSLGLLGPGARPFADRIKAFLASPDPRLRYLAAQALRRIGA